MKMKLPFVLAVLVTTACTLAWGWEAWVLIQNGEWTVASLAVATAFVCIGAGVLVVAAIPAPKFKPDYVSPPGDTLKETILRMGMTLEEFAKHADLNPEVVRRIIEVQGQITRYTAAKLGWATGVPTSFWINREANYRQAIGGIDHKMIQASEEAFLRGESRPLQEYIDELKGR